MKRVVKTDNQSPQHWCVPWNSGGENLPLEFQVITLSLQIGVLIIYMLYIYNTSYYII